MTSPADLALLVEGFDPQRGGAERAVRSLALALAREGLRVDVFAPGGRGGPELEAPARRVEVALPALPRALWARAAARRLGNAARAEGAQRVVACGKLLGADAYWPHGGVHAATLRAALTGRSRLARVGRALRPAEWSYRAIEARAFAECRRGQARAIAISRRVAADMAEHHGIERPLVVSNGVDHARFSPPSEAERLEARLRLEQRAGATSRQEIVLLVANSPRLKGVEVLFEAAAKVPNVFLLVVGHGRAHEWLPLAAQFSLQGRLSFLRWQEDMPSLYRGATLLSHPSRYDPCSLVVLEALACGLPVVGSHADGSSEHIGEAGCVIDPLDSDALAGALAEWTQPQRRRAASEAAASFRRPWSVVGHELIAAIDES